MTDARHPAQWLNDRRFLRLSGDAYKLFSVMLMWSVNNRTEGVILDEDLALLAGVDAANIAELETAELVEYIGERDEWFLCDFAATQTSREELKSNEEYRRRERVRKAKERAEKAAAKNAAADGPGDASADSPQDVHADTSGKGRTGTGKAGKSKSTPGEAGVSSLRCPGCSRPWSEAPRPFVNGLCSTCTSTHNEETGA